MRDVLAELLSACRSGAPAALATVVGAQGSAPRPVGTALLVAADGAVTGSLSGGCVDGDIHHLAHEVLTTGTAVTARFGPETDGLAAGLPCGGTVEVFVEPVSPQWLAVLGEVTAEVAAHRPVAMAAVVAHPDPRVVGRRLMVGPDRVFGGLGSARRDDAVTDDARGLLAAGTSLTLTYGPDGQRRGEGMRVLVVSLAAAPRLIVFGALDVGAALARQGALLGYRVTVCDPRPVFATAARLPDADDVVVDWPHRYLAGERDAGRIHADTALCVLTHDPRFDLPLLGVALRLPAVGYVGAMGSRRTHADRLAALRAAGVTDAELGRLSSPLGLDLGGASPAETALSIAAEIVACRTGASGARLTHTSGPIHRPTPAALRLAR